MATTTNPMKAERFLKVRRHPVKLTALLYLREALRAERYEDCGDFVAIAQEFGANALEVRFLLEDVRRIPRG